MGGRRKGEGETVRDFDKFKKGSVLHHKGINFDNLSPKTALS